MARSLLIGMRETEVREWLALHQGDPEAMEARDFLNRDGRFGEMEQSEPGREQVFPGPPPAEQLQTHVHGSYHDGA
jgi:hypothetical protein